MPSHPTHPRRRLPGAFLRWWAASAASNLGDGVRVTALPLLATELTTDARLVAGVAVAEQLPWLLLILPGGVLADRLDRRDLRVRLDLVRAATMIALTVIVATGSTSIVIVLAVAAILGAAESIVDSSSLALVPALVLDDELERAGALMSSTELIVNSLAGPPLGGLLFAAAMSIPFGLDAASFVAAAVIASTVSGDFRPHGDSIGERRSVRGDIAEGFRWLWGQPLLRNLALVSTVLGFANLMTVAVFVLFARETLELGPFAVGLLLVPPALGGVAGSMLAPRLTLLPLGRVLTVAVATSGLTLVAIGVAPTIWVVALMSAVEAAAILVWNVLTVALRQRVVPDHLLGRVGASYRFLVYGAMPVGAFVGGVIADSTSLPTTFVVAGAIVLATAAIVPVAARPGLVPPLTPA